MSIVAGGRELRRATGRRWDGARLAGPSDPGGGEMTGHCRMRGGPALRWQAFAWLAAAVLSLSPGRGVASSADPAFPPGLRAILPAGRLPVAPPRAHLDYHGGRVISNVELVMVLWGPGTYAPFVTATGPRSLTSFFASVTASPYLDLLAQYGTDRPAVDGRPGTKQSIGRGTFARRIQISPAAANAGNRIDDVNVVAELSAQLAAGALPPPSTDAAGNSSTVYLIYFPAGKTVTLASGVACVTFCAYHGAFTWRGREVYYAVVPDMSPGSGCDVGCGTEALPFDLATSVTSHELAEAITDPEVGFATGMVAPLAWYDPAQGEIGDICNALDGTVTGGDGITYVVQKLWSNADGACVAVPAPAGVAMAAAKDTSKGTDGLASAAVSSGAPVPVRARNVSAVAAGAPANAAPAATGPVPGAPVAPAMAAVPAMPAAPAVPPAPAMPAAAATAAASADAPGPATTSPAVTHPCTCADAASGARPADVSLDAGAPAPTAAAPPDVSAAPSSPPPDPRP
jgi:hypothetical protein